MIDTKQFIFDLPDREAPIGLELFYGVEITYKKPTLKKVQYVLSVAYLKMINNHFICRIERKKLFFNGVQVNGLLDVLAEKCMQLIYPINIKINRYGYCVAIENMEEIRNRWHTNKGKLQQEYKEDSISDYFNQIDNTLKDEKVLFQTLANESVHNLLFAKTQSIYRGNEVIKNFMYKIPVDSYQSRNEFIGDYKMSVNPEDKTTRIAFSAYDHNNGNVKLNYHLHTDFTLLKLTGKYISSDADKEIDYKITRLKEREKAYIDQDMREVKKEPKSKKKWFGLW